jgi:hypothetical protein
MASGMVLVAPALGTPASGVLTNCTALPAAQVAQGTMASGMVLVAPALGTPASGVLTNCTGTAASLTAGAATLAATATLVTATANNTEDATHYLTFIDAQTGGQDIESDVGLTYNPSSGALTSTGFAGSLVGNVTGTSSLVTVSDSTAATAFPVVFNDESNALLDDTGALTYKPSTGNMEVTTIGGELANGDTLKIGPVDATQLVFTPHGTPATEKISLINTNGSAVDAIAITAGSGGITLATEASKHVAITSAALNVSNQSTFSIDIADNAAALTIEGSGSALLTFNSAGSGEGSVGDVILGAGSTAGAYALVPADDNVFDLGASDKRFRNIYTGDLHLRNDRGDWTMIEENAYLSLTNNKTGKTYRLLMEEVDDGSTPSEPTNNTKASAKKSRSL